MAPTTQPDQHESDAYRRSLAMLRRCLSPAGFLASPSEIDNYARVWTRDGVITGLAALASGNDMLIEGMGSTLATLRDHQGPHGEIPSNISIDDHEVSYGMLSGRVDALLWYIIGVCAYIRYTGASHLVATYRVSVERALFLAACWEYNNRNLIYTPLSGNWADEYLQEGYVLSDQLLYMLALHAAGAVFEQEIWLAKAALLRDMLAINYWPHAAQVDSPLVYHKHAYSFQVEQGEPEHWLPSLSPGGYATYFDGLAHALALLAKLGDTAQRRRADAYVQAIAQHIGSALLPAFWPVVQPDDCDWELLATNHLYDQLKNQPFMYHNGGLWPMISGWYAVGLASNGQNERAHDLLAAINAANAQSQQGDTAAWSFSEFHHGQTLAALGTRYLAWSAAAAVLAHQAVYDQVVVLPVL
jgi:GH15 family glucan-1,4-alpha-glucosidase